jgi:hypothetical protein
MTDQRIRLHITPLSPDLLSAILPSSIAHLAKAVSYHTLDVFPERNYGYLELPSMEAEKLRKKLNGSILKGQKIQIEEARPRKRALEENDTCAQDGAAERSAKSGKPPKRAKRGHATIRGHELSPGRKVKRGWTEPTKVKVAKSTRGSSHRAASKYTDKAEVLFRTRLPPNKAKATKSQAKKAKTNSRDVVVHEFEKSTIQPSFLREEGASDTRRAAQYVDGKGWVDEDGAVVEEELRSLRQKPTRLSGRDGPAVGKGRNRATETDNQLSAKERPSHTGASAGSTFFPSTLNPSDGAAEPDDETSSAGLSTDSEAHQTAFSSPPDASKATSFEESETRNTPTPSVHPLEAIFKRPTKAASADIAKPSLELQTSFSFFEPDQGNTTGPPDTPFNSQELRSRKLRSAAPTPDTAAPSRFNSWSSPARNDDEPSDDEGDKEDTMLTAGDATPSKTHTGDKRRQESEFTKFFWENRGDNNRTWKRRAREVKKEKRQRENRQRSRKF